MDDFENALINLINQNPLPFEVKRYVVKHINTLMDFEYWKQISKPKESEEKDGEQVS